MDDDVDTKLADHHDIECFVRSLRIPGFLLVHCHFSQKYWVFGFCLSSGVVKTRTTTCNRAWSQVLYNWHGLFTVWGFSKGPKAVVVPVVPHLGTQTDPISETWCSLVFIMPISGQNLKPLKWCTPLTESFRLYSNIFVLCLRLQFSPVYVI